MFYFLEVLRNFKISQWLLAILFLSMSNVGHTKDWIYTVKPKDTLWDLCLRYTTQKNCWLDIGEYNGVGYPPSLAPGTRISFPVAWLKAQPVPAKVVFVAGDVQRLLPSGEVKVATLNDSLVMGSAMRVFEHSTATLQFADGATLVLEPNSHVVMNLLTQHQHTGMVNTQLNLLSGAAKSRVPKRQPRSNFSVSTPSAIAAVRGTEFRVNAGKGSMHGEVFEGQVDIAKSKNNNILLAKSYGIRVTDGEPLPAPVKLLAPVAWATDDKEITLPYTLAWQQSPKAKHYKVELLAAKKTEEVLFSGLQQGNTWQLPVDTEQCFTVRISAIDVFDLQGMPAVREFCATKKLPIVEQLLLSRRQLQWQPIVGARTYHIESSVDGSFTSPQLIASTCEIFYALSDEQKGLYVRVVAIDAKGRRGQPSATLKIKWANVQGIIATLFFMLMLAL